MYFVPAIRRSVSLFALKGTRWSRATNHKTDHRADGDAQPNVFKIRAGLPIGSDGDSRAHAGFSCGSAWATRLPTTPARSQ